MQGYLVLQFFNFGSSIRNWISTFYKKSSSAVLQCGHLSPFFMLGRGCRQGDPISPYLFILCAEILSARIRNNNQRTNGPVNAHLSLLHIPINMFEYYGI